MMWFIYLFGVIATLTYFTVDLLNETAYRQGKRRALGIYLLVVAAAISWPVFWFLVVFMCRRTPKVRMER